MLLQLLLACVQDPFQGGQQGEDLHDDSELTDGETGAAEDTADPTDSADAGTWTGTVELSATSSCTGPLTLDGAGVGQGNCVFGDGRQWLLTLVGERSGDQVSGTVTEGGTWSGLYAGDTVSGSLQGSRDGEAFTGTFTASQ